MSRDRVRVICSEGFDEQPFHNKEAAQAWIDKFNEARTRMPNSGLCEGEHTVEESNAG